MKKNLYLSFVLILGLFYNFNINSMEIAKSLHSKIITKSNNSPEEFNTFLKSLKLTARNTKKEELNGLLNKILKSYSKLDNLSFTHDQAEHIMEVFDSNKMDWCSNKDGELKTIINNILTITIKNKKNSISSTVIKKIMSSTCAQNLSNLEVKIMIVLTLLRDEKLLKDHIENNQSMCLQEYLIKPSSDSTLIELNGAENNLNITLFPILINDDEILIFIIELISRYVPAYKIAYSAHKSISKFKNNTNKIKCFEKLQDLIHLSFPHIQDIPYIQEGKINFRKVNDYEERFIQIIENYIKSNDIELAKKFIGCDIADFNNYKKEIIKVSIIDLIIRYDNVELFSHIHHLFGIELEHYLPILLDHKSEMSIFVYMVIELIFELKAEKIASYLLKNKLLRTDTFTYKPNTNFNQINNLTDDIPFSRFIYTEYNSLFNYLIAFSSKNIIEMVLDSLDYPLIVSDKKLKYIFTSIPRNIADNSNTFSTVQKYLEIVKKRILQAKSKLKNNDNPFNLDRELHDFIKNDNLNLMEIYLNNNKEKCTKMEKLLFICSKYGSINCFNYLLKKIKNINIRNKDGETLLMDSVRNNQFELFKHILSNEPDLSILNDENKSIYDIIGVKKDGYKFAEHVVKLNLLPCNQLDDNIYWAFEKGYTSFIIELAAVKKMKIDTLVKYNFEKEISRDNNIVKYEKINLFYVLLKNKNLSTIGALKKYLNIHDILDMNYQVYQRPIAADQNRKDNFIKKNLFYYLAELKDHELAEYMVNWIKFTKNLDSSMYKYFEEIVNRETVIHCLVKNKSLSLLKLFCNNFNFNLDVKTTDKLKLNPLELAMAYVIDKDMTSSDSLMILQFLEEMIKNKTTTAELSPKQEEIFLRDRPNNQRIYNFADELARKWLKTPNKGQHHHLQEVDVILKEEGKVVEVSKTKKATKNKKKSAHKTSEDDYFYIQFTRSQLEHNESVYNALVNKKPIPTKVIKINNIETEQLSNKLYNHLRLYLTQIEKTIEDYNIQNNLIADPKLAESMVRKNHWLNIVRIFQTLAHFQRINFNINSSIRDFRDYIVHHFDFLDKNDLTLLFNATIKQKLLDDLVHNKSTNIEDIFKSGNYNELKNKKFRPFNPKLKLHFIKNELNELKKLEGVLIANQIDFLDDEKMLDFFNQDQLDVMNLDARIVNSTMIVKAIEATMVIIGEYFDKSVRELINKDPFLTPGIVDLLRGLRREIRNPNCHQVWIDNSSINNIKIDPIDHKLILQKFNEVLEFLNNY